jgi:hypothetical protein
MNENKKKLLKEKDLLQEDVSEMNFEKHELIRVYAVGITFKEKTFRQSIIDQCYFRRCIFNDCDFTGAHISNTNFQGANFSGCTFDYTIFKTTDIDTIPLSKNLPNGENLKMQLARNLRANYASIGDYARVNFAIKIENSAKLAHLKKAAFSRESYYRKKKEFSGIGRVSHMVQFVSFYALDKLWGNGEKPLRMLYSIPILLTLLSCLFSLFSTHPISYYLTQTFLIFFIGKSSSNIDLVPTIVIVVFRYLAMGLFLSSVVRRLTRR